MNLWGGFSARRAAHNYGWLLAVLAAFAGGALVVFILYTKEAPDGLGLPLPGDTTVKVEAPRSPGLASAEEACKLGKVSRAEIVNGGAKAWKYFAQYGLVTVEWPDSPPGRNAIGLVDGQPVTLSEEVMRCFRGHF